MESNGESAQPFLSYQDSVHGRAVANGSQKAAVCTDCHGAHEILPANDAKSPIYKFNVPGHLRQVPHRRRKHLHAEHSRAGHRARQQARAGLHRLPRHPLHQGATPIPTRRSPSRISRATPARRCHEGVRLSQEFGVPGNRVTSYFDSYHGLAAEGGSVVAANCSSCHGVHNILPSSDPRSTINRANLDATCGKCHKGVTQKFTLHASPSPGWRPHRRHRLHRRALGALDLHPPHPARHRRHVPAQRHHLAQQSRGAPAHAESLHDAHDRESALAASDPAHQLHRSGHHRLRAQVPRLLVRAHAGHGRASAQHHPSHRGRHAHRRRHLSRLLSRHRARRPPAAARHRAPAQRRIRRVGHHALLPRPEQREAEVWPLQLRAKRPSTGRWCGERR